LAVSICKNSLSVNNPVNPRRILCYKLAVQFAEYASWSFHTTDQFHAALPAFPGNGIHHYGLTFSRSIFLSQTRQQISDKRGYTAPTWQMFTY